MDWSAVSDVREALAKNELRGLERGFVPANDAHAATLLALTSPERVAMLARPTLVDILAVAGHRLLGVGRYAEALTLFDDAIESDRHHDLSLYVNALWAVQDDNHHLGKMPERAHRYLACCLPYARQAPAIFFNAACVCVELGELDRARALAMPGVLPFAFDGGGVFYAFDMREAAVDGEFPVVVFHASTPFWEESAVVAASFEELCRGTTRV